MTNVKRWLYLNLFDTTLTVMEYYDMARHWWRGLQLPYFMPHVWQAMLLCVFGVGGAVGIGLALWTLSVRGLL